MIRNRMKPLDSWDSDRRNVRFVKYLEEGLTMVQAAKLVGVPYEAMRRRRRRVAGFEDEVMRAMAAGDEERKYRAWLHHPFRGKRPPTGKGHGGKPRYTYGRR
ncbi:MAG: hypothetical protein E6R03_02445 [Hyphomicrobiaceae bacterium]|nr:MAG: hypothetical protein E6R03_02445 [Hyphomicrobiaceae bacterium]